MRSAAGTAALLLLAWAGGAGAHSRGMSYSDWQLDGAGAHVQARVSQLELTRLALHPGMPDYAPRVAALLAAELQLWSGLARRARRRRAPVTTAGSSPTGP